VRGTVHIKDQYGRELLESPGGADTFEAMAVVIQANGGFGESVSLNGEDAENFVNEIANPSTDERRLSHLKRSDETFEKSFSSEPISQLPSNE
jgi:hypothetical protein